MYVATVLLSQTAIEHMLAGLLRLAGMDAIRRGSLGVPLRQIGPLDMLLYTRRPMSRVSRRRTAPSPGQLTLGFDEDPLAIRMVLEGLVRESDPTARLIPELGVRGGAGRIDLAAAGSELVGWEIKGSRDSLVRLPRQADLYSQIFERLTLVAPERHLVAAEHCVPRWWGLMSVGDRVLSIERAPERNPAPDAMALAELLWKDEALGLVERRTGRRLRGTRRAIWQNLVDSASEAEMAQIVCAQLRQRPGWRAAA